MKRLANIIRERIGHKPVVANIMHAISDAEALSLRDSIRSYVDCAEIIVSDFTPVMGAHTGTGVIGAAFHSKDTT